MNPEGQADNANHLRMQQVQRQWASSKVRRIIDFSADLTTGKAPTKKTLDDLPDY